MVCEDFERASDATGGAHMLGIGEKIFHIDSSSSYTIVGVSEIKDNPVVKDGVYYTVHSDSLPAETGYYPIGVNNVDSENSRFFSSMEKAKEALSRFSEQNEEYQ